MNSPPFAAAYVHYTEKLAAYAHVLRRVMTITDVAVVTALSWDTVRGLVQARLQTPEASVA